MGSSLQFPFEHFKKGERKGGRGEEGGRRDFKRAAAWHCIRPCSAPKKEESNSLQKWREELL